jgi:hypothetical protein
MSPGLASTIDTGAGWQMIAEGRHDLGQVPLISMNTAPTGFMQARPPLIDLAWLNLAHWQSSSDQRHILHVARVPILFARALQIAEGKLEIGPNRLVLADDPAADLRFVEHSGAAIAAGRQDLVDLEDRMAVLGLEMLSRQSGDATATARALDAAQTHATLTGILQVLRDGTESALMMMAGMMGLPPSAAGTLVMTQQFPVRDAATAEADLLLRARLAGEISQTAFLAEIGRRGILDGGSQAPSVPNKPTTDNSTPKPSTQNPPPQPKPPNLPPQPKPQPKPQAKTQPNRKDQTSND